MQDFGCAFCFEKLPLAKHVNELRVDCSFFHEFVNSWNLIVQDICSLLLFSLSLGNSMRTTVRSNNLYFILKAISNILNCPQHLDFVFGVQPIA